MKYKDFTEFPVWKKAFSLLLFVYKVTKNFPSEEKFGITSDMRRSANSIVHNIAEGFGRFEARDKSRFYKFSRGSSFELHSQTLVSEALEYMNSKDSITIITDTRDIIEELNNLIKSIEK